MPFGCLEWFLYVRAVALVQQTTCIYWKNRSITATPEKHWIHTKSTKLIIFQTFSHKEVSQNDSIKKRNISGLENANIQIIFNFEFIYERNALYKNKCRTQKRQIAYSRLQFKLDLAKFTRDSFFCFRKKIFFVKKDDAYSLPPLLMASIFGSIILYLWGIPCVQ